MYIILSWCSYEADPRDNTLLCKVVTRHTSMFRSADEWRPFRSVGVIVPSIKSQAPTRFRSIATKPIFSPCYTTLTFSHTTMLLTCRSRPLRLIARTLASTSRAGPYSTKSLPSFDPEPSPLTQRPNPSWKLGDGLRTDTELTKKWKEDGKQGWKSWDLERLAPL